MRSDAVSNPFPWPTPRTCSGHDAERNFSASPRGCRARLLPIPIARHRPGSAASWNSAISPCPTTTIRTIRGARATSCSRSASRRFSPTGWASTRPGSASTISTGSASTPAPTWCWRAFVPVTERIRLAPAVNVLPIHHPIHVAECWATLDLVSGGRVDYATGRGYDRAEYEPFGADFMQSKEIFEEGIDVVLKGVDRARHVVAQGRVLRHPRHGDHAQAGAAADPGLYRVLLGHQHGDGGETRAQHHLRSVRGLDDLRRARPGGGAVPRGLREGGQRAGSCQVQLFHPPRRHPGRGGFRPPGDDGLFPPLRASGLPGRPLQDAAHDALLHEDQRDPARHDQGDAVRQVDP